MNTALFLRRALSVGLSIHDLDELSVGMVNDIFVEAINDSYEYSYIATQADKDAL